MTTLCQEGVLLGLGNPLLDISATADETFLAKYGLDANSAILADDKHIPLYKEMEDNYSVDYLAGGATQNSMRVAQNIIGLKGACSFMGSVGNDQYSKMLEKKSTEAGINVKYQYSDEHPTGTCAVIITQKGKCRSLIANLGAANHFSKSHLDVLENRKLIDKAKYFYISGFFLTVSIDSILEVGRHASKNNCIFSMNLSAQFLCEFFAEPMMKAFPYIDILFGNETEAAMFSKVQKFETTDLKEIALKIAALPKDNQNRTRTVIITQGADNVIVAKDGKITEFPAIKLTEDQLIDTNGAGDAFVGGFLSQRVQDKTLEQCVKCGIWAATLIIQQSGCTFPEGAKFSS